MESPKGLAMEGSSVIKKKKKKVFACVAKMNTVKVILSFMVNLDWPLR